MMILDNGPVGLVSSQLKALTDIPAVNFYSVDKEFRYTFFTSTHARKMRELWGIEIAVGMDILTEVIGAIHDRAKANNSLFWALSGNDFTVTEAFGMASNRRLFESRYSPTRAEDGKVVGINVSMTDVTAQVQLLNDQRALDQKLLQSSHLASLGLMVGCVTHDFNNLLLPVLLNAELALKTVDDEHPAVELLREIIGGVRCASGLTKQLLSFGGHANIDKEVLDLNEVVKSVSELTRVAIDRRAELRTSLSAGALQINANSSQLRQIIVNLLTNASEAECGKRLQVTVETGLLTVSGPIRSRRLVTSHPPSGEYAVLSVHDDGIGMSAEQLEHVLQPFFSTKGDGRGLGLTAVQRIVNHHKGFLAIDSTPGVGTTFRIGFPVACAVAESLVLDDESLLLDEVTPFKPLRILVVDDNPGSLKSIAAVCSMLGHTVTSAAHANVAIPAITLGHFDLVLLDVDMASRSSDSVLASIPEDLSTPVVLMSAEGQPLMLMDMPRIHGVLLKPFSTNDLVSTLQRIQPTSAYPPAPHIPRLKKSTNVLEQRSA